MSKRPGARWWTSWPVIILGLLLGVIPGVVLLWMRIGTRAWVKITVTVVALPVVFSMASPQSGTDPDTGAAGLATSAAPTSSPFATEAPSPSPSSFATPSESASPTPHPTLRADAESPRGEESDDSAEGTAKAATLALTVKGRAAKTGYDRDEFGRGWVDVDRNGCDTRNDMLIQRLSNRDMSGSCKVMAGDLLDPFSATWIHFERGGASEVDVDHLVALSDAWQKGAAQWEFAKRVAFANDPLNLEPVDARLNRQKGDGDAATWLPPNKEFRCQYVARQVAVKTKYGVWVTEAEQSAILRVLESCPGEPLPSPGDQPVIAENTGGPPPAREPDPEPAKPAPAKTEAPSAEAKTDTRYPYCKDLPAGYGPYVRGEDPEYEWYSDRDGDGIVCE